MKYYLQSLIAAAIIVAALFGVSYLATSASFKADNIVTGGVSSGSNMISMVGQSISMDTAFATKTLLIANSNPAAVPTMIRMVYSGNSTVGNTAGVFSSYVDCGNVAACYAGHFENVDYGTALVTEVHGSLSKYSAYLRKCTETGTGAGNAGNGCSDTNEVVRIENKAKGAGILVLNDYNSTTNPGVYVYHRGTGSLFKGTSRDTTHAGSLLELEDNDVDAFVVNHTGSITIAENIANTGTITATGTIRSNTGFSVGATAGATLCVEYLEDAVTTKYMKFLCGIMVGIFTDAACSTP